MSALDGLQLLTIALRLFAGGSITPADLAVFARVLGGLLTPEHIQAAADWAKVAGGHLVVVLRDGQAWLEAHPGPTPTWPAIGSSDHGGEQAPLPAIPVTPEMVARFRLELRPLKERGPG